LDEKIGKIQNVLEIIFKEALNVAIMDKKLLQKEKDSIAE